MTDLKSPGVGAPLPAAAPPPPQQRGPSGRAMPRAFEQMMEWLRPEDFRYAKVLLCHTPFIGDMVEALKLLDKVTKYAQQAEGLAGSGRIRGSEMDAFRDGLEEYLCGILEACVEMAKRANSIHKLGKGEYKVLNRHGIKIDKSKKSKPGPDKASAEPRLATAAAA